jgi:putative membrane protein
MGRLLALVCGSLLSFGSMIPAGDDKKDNDETFDDNTFVQKAASGGMHEVALGKIAQIKAKNEQVKAFAERMVADHSKANEELKKIAGSIGIKVPDEMSERHQKEVERFKNYSGSNFDGDYIKHMIADHEKDLALFTRASQEARNPALKEFAAKTLAIVKEHLAAAKKIKTEE